MQNGHRYRFSYGEDNGPRQIIEATLAGDPEVTIEDVGFWPSGVPIKAIRLWQPVEEVLIDGKPLGAPATIRLDCIHDEQEVP